MRRLALFTAVALSASACTMTSSGKKSLIAGGAVATAAGALMYAAGPTVVDSNHNGYNEDPLNDNYTMPILGALAVTAGIAMIVGGAAADEVSETAIAPLPVQPVQFAGPPGRSVRLVEPLPEVPADAETLRLAKQTRVVISSGHCEAARPLLADIELRAPAYHRALFEGPVIDPCPSLRYTR